MNDLIRAIIRAHRQHHSHYDQISEKFWDIDVLTTAQVLYRFCKREMQYIIEPVHTQTVRTPQVIIRDRHLGVDSKHYAGFIAGVLDSLRRNGHKEIKSLQYRFVADRGGVDVHHVFIVMNRSIWIDPCVEFNERRKWTRELNFLVK